MSKKNSSVNLSSLINDREDLREIYLSFKNKPVDKKSYLIGVSGGPDSMALAALSKIYSLGLMLKYITLWSTIVLERILQKKQSKLKNC